MEKLSFKQVYEKLEYLFIENTKEMSPDEVAEEIREKIREMGWECLDESFYDDELEWIENHPEVNSEECEWCAITELDFLCDNSEWERISSHDVEWRTFEITFYGIWDKVGVFSVAH